MICSDSAMLTLPTHKTKDSFLTLLMAARRMFTSVALILVSYLGLQGQLSANDTVAQDFFTHDLFGYGRIQSAERDPAQLITDSEKVVLKGDGYEHLIVAMHGVEYIDYAWQRIGIVRAIGFQKQEQWIPLLVEKVTEIRWPKSSVQPAEVVFPCVWALAKIGEPSVEPVMKALASSRDLQERRLLVLAIVGIRGEAGAASLLKENGININLPFDGPSRPSKRGPNVAQELKERSLASRHESGRQEAEASYEAKDRRTWMYLAVLMVLGIGITVVWRAWWKARFRKDLGSSK